MPVPLEAVKKPAIEPGPTAEPLSAVPLPFWVTSKAVPVLVVERLVLAVPAELVVLPRMSGSPEAARVGLTLSTDDTAQAARPPNAPASTARRDRDSDSG